MRCCKECVETKAVTEFAVSKRTTSGVPVYRRICKRCYARRAARWRAENPDRLREYNREYCAANREAERERNRVKVRDWKPKNDRRHAYAKTARWTRTEVIDRYGLGCYICGTEIDTSLRWPNPRSFTVDHVVPFALGGQNELWNVRPAHLRCNCSKGVKLIQLVA